MSSKPSRADVFAVPNTAEILPRCRHFGLCGGCQLQHLTEPTQLQWKTETVLAHLRHAGVPVPVITIHAAAAYEYRNRVRLRVAGGRVGYSRRSSNEFLPVVECPIASPLLWRAADTLQRLAANATPWPDGTVEVELVADAQEMTLQMLLHVDATVATLDRDAPGHFRALCDALQVDMPQLVGAGLLVQRELQTGSRRVQERQRIEVARWGTPHLTHRVNEESHIVSRGAFFQVNRFLTECMVDLVVGTRSGHHAWDLFAGSGLFAVPLARRFQQVTAVEIGQPAAGDLAQALRRIGPQHRAVALPVAEFLKRPPTPRPDLIVMDPPRAGLGFAVTQRLAQVAAAELVYISCNAETFARDTRALVDSRYAVTELHLLDLFPQTTHTETIAVFRRS